MHGERGPRAAGHRGPQRRDPPCGGRRKPWGCRGLVRGWFGCRVGHGDANGPFPSPREGRAAPAAAARRGRRQGLGRRRQRDAGERGGKNPERERKAKEDSAAGQARAAGAVGGPQQEPRWSWGWGCGSGRGSSPPGRRLGPRGPAAVAPPLLERHGRGKLIWKGRTWRGCSACSPLGQVFEQYLPEAFNHFS